MRNANHFALSAVLAASVFLLLTPDAAWSCGESLFRIGKGVHYRAFSAPIPGTVLLFARSAQERNVAEQLQQAGHAVVVVDSETDLSIRLDQDDIDVVIAPVSMRAAYESAAETSAAPPDWVPVFEGHEADSRSVRTEYGRGVSSDDDVRQYLKAIHRSLKSQGG